MKLQLAMPLCLVMVLSVAQAQSQLAAKPEHASASSADANAPTIPLALVEPEWAGQVCLLADGKLIPLEKQKPTVGLKMKKMGFSGAQAAASFAGTTSTIPAKSNAEFVVKMERDGDPDGLVNLDKLVVNEKEGTRIVPLMKAGGLLHPGAKSTADDGIVSLSFSKYGTSSLKFTASAPLSPGEYVVTTKGGQFAYLFKVQ